MNIHDIKALTKAMLDLEKDVPVMERARGVLLDEVRRGDKDAIDDLQRQIAYREDLRNALDALLLAMNNGAETFQKFERKCAKDRLILLEAKKGTGKSGFDDKDPILTAQRLAMSRSLQKVDFLIVELGKLRESLNHKYSARTLPEVVQLNKALRVDVSRWDDESYILNLRKSLSNLLELYHLPS